MGWGVLAWCTKYLQQPDGVNAGQRWRFTPRQVRFVLWWYAVDEAGRWLFHRGALRWSKGAGKSPFVAALTWVEFCGPVIFDRFDPAAEGGCVGRAQPMPWVQIAAVSKEQCKNTMIMVLAMAPKASRLVRDYGIDLGKEIIYKPGGGRLEIITSSAHSAEGNRPTFVIPDEVQWWLGPNGGHELSQTIRRNLGKTGGRQLETCNAFVPGEDSVAERTYAAFVAQQEGRTRGRGVLYDAVEAPPDTDLADETSLRAGLRVAYQDATWQDMDRLVAEIWDPSTPPDVARRFYLNQIVAASDAWVAPHEWVACADPTVVVADGDAVVLFLDGSKSRDATAIVGCHVETGHVFEVGVWEPDRGDPDSVVPVYEVDAAVQMAFDRWNVQAFFSDVREWESFVHTTWPERYRDRLVLWGTPGGKSPSPIAWDMRVKVQDFTMAAEACHAEIVERQLTHDGSSATARHVGNARRRPNRWGVAIGKESPDSPRKIDAAVCVIGARMVRRLLLASPEYRRAATTTRTGRVYGF